MEVIETSFTGVIHPVMDEPGRWSGYLEIEGKDSLDVFFAYNYFKDKELHSARNTFVTALGTLDHYEEEGNGYRAGDPFFVITSMEYHETLPVEKPQKGAKVKYYAGIGSRATPPRVLTFMTKVASWMEQEGWILRSGAAEGADMAFENGVMDDSHKVIYLPWQYFNHSMSRHYGVTQDAIELMRQFHPAPDRLSQGAVKLMARNGYQILGKDLQTPAKLVICWTSEGKGNGGTGQAIRIAKHYGITVYDLGNPMLLAKIEKGSGIAY